MGSVVVALIWLALIHTSSRMASKADDASKQEALDWVSAVIGEPLPGDFHKVLKDGTILCKLINKISPGSVKKVATKGSNFQLMENIAAYQKAVKKYGVPQEEIFQTADLFEARNLKQVALHIHALGRIATNKGFAGPGLGPKMAEECKREFTEEQIRQGRDAHLGLQMGQNQGANASGVTMGGQRHM